MIGKVLPRIMILLSPLVLAACGAETSEPTQPTTGPDGVAGLEVSNARLVLPAVEGNPGAAYFDLTNNGSSSIAIGGVFIDKAQSAMMHQYASDDGGEKTMTPLNSPALAPGASLPFKPGGNHVMAMDLQEGLKAGDAVEITITIAGGDKQSFKADVVAPGMGETGG